jgi:hypothetical protein
MKALFELGWAGGTAERAFRRVKPLDALPWESLDPSRFEVPLVESARKAWTFGALSEYSTAATFNALLADLLAARAPIDLIGMAGAFVADEMVHTELNARMATALGGAAPMLVDFDALVTGIDAKRPPMDRIAARAARLVIGEALSVPLLSHNAALASLPLTRAVLSRLAHDEPAHAHFAWLTLEWALPAVEDRSHVVEAARDALNDYAPDFDVESVDTDDAQVTQLGWLPTGMWLATARRALMRIDRRFAALGLPGAVALAFAAKCV